jgi:hypothetical protein
MIRRTPSRRLALLVAALMGGCAYGPPPYVGVGPHPQISRGRQAKVIDGLGNVLGVHHKIFLGNAKLSNHYITHATETYLQRYIDLPESNTEGTLFSLNEWAPWRDLDRLKDNKKVNWIYRVLLGLPITLVSIILPGRLLGGDHYNPFTDTVNIYSNLPVVVLHEAGHVHDFNSRKYKGTYAALRILPFFDLYQEFLASDEAIEHIISTGEVKQELSAYKVLYPAYGTYVGGYLGYLFPGGSIIGVAIGHLIGRAKASSKSREYLKEAVAKPGERDVDSPSVRTAPRQRKPAMSIP